MFCFSRVSLFESSTELSWKLQDKNGWTNTLWANHLQFLPYPLHKGWAIMKVLNLQLVFLS